MSSNQQVVAQSQSVQSSSTVQKSSTTSMVATKTQTSYSSSSYKSSSSKTVTSSGADGSGLDIEAEMARMKEKLDQEMNVMKLQALQLLPVSSGGIGPDKDLVKLDHQSIQQFIDTKTNDKVRFNFDVTEFQSESVRVTSDGNKIEVHAKKQVQKGDNEASEEYTRVYELPGGVDTTHVTSALVPGGKTFTVELPMMKVNQ